MGGSRGGEGGAGEGVDEDSGSEQEDERAGEAAAAEVERDCEDGGAHAGGAAAGGGARDVWFAVTSVEPPSLRASAFLVSARESALNEAGLVARRLPLCPPAPSPFRDGAAHKQVHI